jgi:non-ribosomal peptide synthetase component F
VVRLFTATEAWYGFGPSDVWTLFHSYAFDFSVWELWGALLYGGRVVVVPYYVSRSPDAFYELLGREGVTVLNQTPSAFRQLIHAAWRRPRNEPRAPLRGIRGKRSSFRPASVVRKFGDEAGPDQHVQDHRDDGPRHLSADHVARVRASLGSVIEHPHPRSGHRLLDERMKSVGRRAGRKSSSKEQASLAAL